MSHVLTLKVKGVTVLRGLMSQCFKTHLQQPVYNCLKLRLVVTHFLNVSMLEQRQMDWSVHLFHEWAAHATFAHSVTHSDLNSQEVAPSRWLPGATPYRVTGAQWKCSLCQNDGRGMKMSCSGEYKEMKHNTHTIISHSSLNDHLMKLLEFIWDSLPVIWGWWRETSHAIMNNLVRLWE